MNHGLWILFLSLATGNPNGVHIAGMLAGSLQRIAAILAWIRVIGESHGGAIQPFMAFGMSVGKIKVRRSHMKAGGESPITASVKLFAAVPSLPIDQPPSFSPRMSAPSIQTYLSVGRVICVRFFKLLAATHAPHRSNTCRRKSCPKNKARCSRNSPSTDNAGRPGSGRHRILAIGIKRAGDTRARRLKTHFREIFLRRLGVSEDSGRKRYIQ